MLKAPTFSKQPATTSTAISDSEEKCCHCHSEVYCVIGGHSAWCRKSCVCLQHHATVVTSNGVTICGSHFAPAVSKHCQQQHSAIPKQFSNMKYQQSQLLWYPMCGFLSSASWQPLFTTTAVSPLMYIHVCQNTTKIISQNSNSYSVPSLPAQTLTLLPKKSNYQHTEVYFYLSMTQLNVVKTLLNWIKNYKYWIGAEW
jgi:hypothetical protein